MATAAPSVTSRERHRSINDNPSKPEDWDQGDERETPLQMVLRPRPLPRADRLRDVVVQHRQGHLVQAAGQVAHGFMRRLHEGRVYERSERQASARAVTVGDDITQQAPRDGFQHAPVGANADRDASEPPAAVGAFMLQVGQGRRNDAFESVAIEDALREAHQAATVKSSAHRAGSIVNVFASVDHASKMRRPCAVT